MEGIKSNITKEELHSLEAEQLSLPVVVLSYASSVEEIVSVCDHLRRGNKVIGFDAETKPAFRKGSYFKVALLQFACPDLVVLVRLLPQLSSKQQEPIRRLLKSKRLLKVGVGIGNDAQSLWTDHQLITNTMLDLGRLSKAAGLEVLSLTKLYAVLFGKRISKGQRLSDWERDELTPAQIEYAALDAEAGLNIYRALEPLVKRDMYFDVVTSAPKKGYLKAKSRRKNKE